MTIREQSEAIESQILAPYACLSKNSKGRQHPQEKCDIRTEFARDRDRIIHCKAFRRLKHKTQVFISLDNDHFRTRLTHTLEVSQIARTIAKATRLNEELVEAICLGHDLGHTPFGHAGEKVLDTLCPGGFRHYKQSLRVVDVIERDGEGLNLTYEVRDGIVNHTGSNQAHTAEGRLVKFADRIAYVNHDIDDAIRDGILQAEDLPCEYTEILGDTHSKRINTLNTDIIYETLRTGEVAMTQPVETAMLGLRQFLFDHVYTKLSQRDHQAAMVIEKLYGYFLQHTDELPDEYRVLLERYEKEQVVCDYIAGMTDYYSIRMFDKLFMPVRL